MQIIAIPGFSEPFSSWSHLLAAGAACAGLFFLWHKGRGNSTRLFSLVVYSVTLMFLFSMSGVYHLLQPDLTPRMVFQRLDHAAIWVLIAGTFTPVHMILFRGAWRWGVLFSVWTIAVTGMVLEVVFFTSIPHWLGIGFYLALGWVGVLTSWRFHKTFADKSIRLLWQGGLYYSIGAVFELAGWPELVPGVVGPHEIFHVFVVLGAWSHWRFVYTWAHYPTKTHITFHVRVFPDNQYIAEAVGEFIRIEAGSLEALREKIRNSIRRAFHHNMRPKSVRLQYFNEELL